ncbi:hypothetical protein FB451DRAFT_1227035 [Mycena latifolia]|nr:hypothetical protein FB451DRAFT_1227035 [Mycena latifolia]
MYRSHFHSLFPNNLDLDGDGAEGDEQSLNSGTTLLRGSQKAPKRPWLQSSKLLRLFSFILHLALVGLHLLLVDVWLQHLEHRAVFPLSYQKIASFVITATTTTFGTVYSALLVFITQRLSMRRSLQMDQTLTATHDTAEAWSGIGSALGHVWHQRTVPASVMGVVGVFLYLGNILVLHITTPVLFSLETFNSSRSIPVATQSLPTLNYSVYDLGNAMDSFIALSDLILDNVQSLVFLPSVVGSETTLGLYQGTLYDVLDINTGIGNATVNATGFNITCGYPTDVDIQFVTTGYSGVWAPTLDSGGSWTLTLDGGLSNYSIPSTAPGIIALPALGSFQKTVNSIVLYSTIPIIDSNGNQGMRVNLIPPMNSSVSSIQILRCSQSLVPQIAVVDALSRQIYPDSATPKFRKTTSAWLPYTGPADESSLELNFTVGNPLINTWAQWYSMMPTSVDFVLDVNSAQTNLASVADLCQVEDLHLLPANRSDAPSSVALHDLENTLSKIVASMFWTLGHNPPKHGVSIVPASENTTGASMYLGFGDAVHTPIFLAGNASVTELSAQTRLDLNIIAVGTGLGASVFLLLLSLPTSLFLTATKNGQGENVTIDGTGMLHAIWLYRNHPELQAALDQVEHPTNKNLRKAGMVRTRLARERLRKSKSFDSLEMTARM